MRGQLGLLSNEIEIEPNLFWRRHVDQIEDYNVPVADSYTPIIQPLPFPPPVENHGDLVAEPSEQTEVVLREIDCQPSKPAAEFLVCSPSSQIEPVPIRRYLTRERKPPAQIDL